MAATPWILISIIALIIILAIVVLATRKHKNTPTDYYSLFNIGVIWLIIGIPLENYTLFILGLVFSITGIANKDKWKSGHVPWNKLEHTERRFKLILMVALGLIVLFGILMLFLFRLL